MGVWASPFDFATPKLKLQEKTRGGNMTKGRWAKPFAWLRLIFRCYWSAITTPLTEEEKRELGIW
jgi:hypothetical protein